MLALLALPLVLLTARAPQEQAAPADLTELLPAVLEARGVPALGCAAFDRAGLRGLAAIGRRSADGEVEVTADDRWHLGSCTKAMTATLVARLVEQAVLGWDTTIGEVFTDLAERMHPAWREVPLELLVSNRAGTPAQLNRKPLWRVLLAHTGTPREQRRTLVEGVLAGPPESPPGTESAYSNAGSCIAGAMLEALTDTSWEELMQRELFAPLNMESAGFGLPGTAGELDEPVGHQPRESGPHPMGTARAADHPRSLGPAGRVHASLADRARFARAHLARDESYLSNESWERLHAPLDGQDYGHGWGFYERDWAGGLAMHHSGSNTMWSCTVWMAPELGLGFLPAASMGGPRAAAACDDVAVALVERYVAKTGAGR